MSLAGAVLLDPCACYGGEVWTIHLAAGCILKVE